MRRPRGAAGGTDCLRARLLPNSIKRGKGRSPFRIYAPEIRERLRGSPRTSTPHNPETRDFFKRGYVRGSTTGGERRRHISKSTNGARVLSEPPRGMRDQRRKLRSLKRKICDTENAKNILCTVYFLKRECKKIPPKGREKCRNDILLFGENWGKRFLHTFFGKNRGYNYSCKSAKKNTKTG